MKQRIREGSEAVEREFYAEHITDEWRADLAKLTLAVEKPFLTEAPCLIVIFKEWWIQKEDGTRDKNYYVTESACLATGLLINALRNAGYASLTYTPAPPTFLWELLGRPEGETPIMVLCVGKPDLSYELPKLTRKELGEFTSYFE